MSVLVWKSHRKNGKVITVKSSRSLRTIYFNKICLYGGIWVFAKVPCGGQFEAVPVYSVFNLYDTFVNPKLSK